MLHNFALYIYHITLPCYDRKSAFLASSEVFCVLIIDGFEHVALVDPLATLTGRAAAALAAAVLRRLPMPGRLEWLVPVPEILTRSRSTRFRNGLGRFSSSDKSCCTGACVDAVAATFDIVALGSVLEVVGFTAITERADEEAGRVAAL